MVREMGPSEAGKRQTLVENAATTSENRTRRLFVRDRENGISFLVDSGADVSTLPPGPRDKDANNDFRLYAANGTVISTYGERS